MVTPRSVQDAMHVSRSLGKFRRVRSPAITSRSLAPVLITGH